MKHFSLTTIVICILIAAQGVFAQQRKFGLGIVLGEPAGISAKLWTSNHTAFDFGFGWSMGGDQIGRYNYYYGGNRIHFHMDYLWHSFDAINSGEQFPLFYGVGGRVNTGAGINSSVAVRGVLGIAWLPRETPIDIFLEIVPLFQVSPSSGFGLDAGVGARYFF